MVAQIKGIICELVKCASIIIFKELNLGMYILARCAPGHSWINPAERIMSILNLGLQNVSLEHQQGSEVTEKALKDCKSMNDIRKLAEKDMKNVGSTKTWLKKHICNLEILHLGYTIFRKDRTTRGGEVFLGVRTSSFKSVHEVKHNHDLQSWTKIVAKTDL